MDFYQIRSRDLKSGKIELYPDFQVGDDSEDLKIRGGKFYAIWDDQRSLWSTNDNDVRRLVDEDLEREQKRLDSETGVLPLVRFMRSYDSKSWKTWKQYERDSPDSWHPLNTSVVFSNTEVKKTDYASFKLTYP